MAEEETPAPELIRVSPEEVDEVLGTSEEKPEGEAEEPEEGVDVEAVFICYKDAETGHWLAELDLERSFKPRRLANFNDFYHAAGDIKSDVESANTAERIIQRQMQQAQQMARQMEQQRIAKMIQEQRENPGARPAPGSQLLRGRRG